MEVGEEIFTNFHVSNSYLQVQCKAVSAADFAAKTFLCGCEKHEHGHSSECDNECIIKRVMGVLSVRGRHHQHS